ncbi:glutamate--cysteine ligase-like [Lingula anatina]|uniref:Glutamate--cysteine ligase n=1 Tax=Lingula anatina TaxID=7574 RepID=A0A1S3K668_LINAN|nr:glutamate--cysteine ligase-like [Lingula anatina]|eukprot:XP_013418128.1 glutamate--cysteine ligase-like [Lingula anatina]
MNGLEQNGERWLTSDEIAGVWPQIRLNAAREFIGLYHKEKDARKRGLLWGDEIEYILVYLDHENKSVKVSLESEELLEKLKRLDFNNVCPAMWQREYARYMVESVPFVPFSGGIESIRSVEASMANSVAAQNCTSNKRGRYTERIPIFKDVHTMDAIKEDLSHTSYKGKEQEDSQPGTIRLDMCVCGGTCCALQVTLQAADLDEARTLHDQLTPLCPILNKRSGAHRTTKTRNDSVSCYAQPYNSCYNDGPMFTDDEIFGTLVDEDAV